MIAIAMLPAALTCGRRSAVLRAGAAAALALAPARGGRAADGGGGGALASATFSAGDARFLQPAFDEIVYLGVRSSEVGAVRLADGSELPALRVVYDPTRVRYRRVLGAFWRAIDPTRAAGEGQFGIVGPSVIWAASEAERADAVESLRRLDASGLFRGRRIATEVRLLPAPEASAARGGAADGALLPSWVPAPAAAQCWYRAQPQAYAKARVDTGRDAWFDRTYRPVKTTACDGGVCGFVTFPCSDENGCLAVMNGSW